MVCSDPWSGGRSVSQLMPDEMTGEIVKCRSHRVHPHEVRVYGGDVRFRSFGRLGHVAHDAVDAKMTRLPSRSFPRPQTGELESRLGVGRASSPADLRPVEQLVMAPVHRPPRQHHRARV